MKKLLFLLFGLSLFLFNSVYSSWYYPGWDYRVPITIQERSGNTLTDYQVMLSVNTANLISQGKLKSDCSDIRFTYLNTSDDKEYEIPYWIESGCNTASTRIWIKIPYIPANGNATVYMYYGNPDATSKSNLTAVWGFGVVAFYNFEGDTRDYSGNNIHLTVSGTATFIQGRFGKAIDFQSGLAYYDYIAGDLIDQITQNYTIILYVRTPDPQNHQHWFGITTSTSGHTYGNIYINSQTSQLWDRLYYGSGTMHVVAFSASYIQANKWYKVAAKANTTHHCLYINNLYRNCTTYSGTRYISSREF
jgi:Uncharacterized conserved protein